MATLSEAFVDIERDFIREKILPDFEYTSFVEPSRRVPLAKALAESRVALISTCGAHLAGDQPFIIDSPRGDDSYRVVPVDSPREELRLTHPGYNVARVRQDVNTVFPVDRLKELVVEGFIGSLSANAYTFCKAEVVPSIVEELKEDRVDLALLVPAWPICQQSVGLIQRVIDSCGLSTVSLTVLKEYTLMVKPSLAAFVPHPFGYTLGDINDQHFWNRTGGFPDGTVVDLPFTWTADDLRDRQLEKKAK